MMRLLEGGKRQSMVKDMISTEKIMLRRVHNCLQLR